MGVVLTSVAMVSQERLDVQIEGGAGQRELEAGDHVWMKDPEASHTLPARKDLCTAAGEEG